MTNDIRGFLIAGALALGLAGSGVAVAGPYQDAAAAYQQQDYVTALAKFRALADKGDAKAQFALGVLYDNGRGVAQDYAEAMKWYRLSAAQGNAQAQNNLGLLYADGHGVAQDYAEALKWYRLAANQGFVEAQHSLGLMYYYGQGVAQDDLHAHMWLNLAAVQGDTSSATVRDEISAKMTKEQLTQAVEMAMQCLKSDYKACD